MTTIFSPISSHTANPYLNVNNTHNQPAENSKKSVIELTPDEQNVSSGDRSNNITQINITTPSKELELEISREQAFNALEIKTQKKILNQGAQKALSGNPYGSINNGSSDNSSQTAPPLVQLNEAQNAYMKQQLVFSTIDRLDISQKI